MEDYITVNKEVYDVLHREYAGRARERSVYDERPEVLAGSVLSIVRPRFDQIAALEIGPGSGEILAYLEKNGCQTTAVELSTKMAHIAKARSPSTVFILGNILDVEFLESQFEIIYAGALIHLFPISDAIRLITKFYRWLKPKGIFFVNTTVHAASEEGFYEKVDYGIPVRRFRRRWTESELVSVLRDSHFEIVQRLVTDERDRGKLWTAFLCTKPDD